MPRNPLTFPFPPAHNPLQLVNHLFILVSNKYLNLLLQLESLIEQLDKPESQIQAIRLLNEVVDFYWPEISEVSAKM